MQLNLSEVSDGASQILSAVQTILSDILSKRTDLSEEQVLSLIEEKKKEGRGLLSDEGAARLVAEELLIQTRGTELGRMQVKDLVSGLNDVTISGRVLLAWPPQEFQRRDGTRGRVMRLTIVDKTGRARCALWDRHADVAARASNLQGKMVRIGHAYTRQGLAGDPELHAGERSSLEIDPANLPGDEFPAFEELFIPIMKITPDSLQVNTVGVVNFDPRVYNFTKDDRTGSVLRTVLADESGSIPLVAWNERAEELRALKRGDVLQVINARARLDNNSRAELHVETRSQVSILSEPPKYLKLPTPTEARTYKLAELSAQTGIADLEVQVMAKGQAREVKRPTGDNVKVSSLLIGDQTGLASISLWDDKAELVEQIREGDILELRTVSVREQMGEVRLSLGKSGELIKSAASKEFKITPAKLNSLANARGLLVVEATVSEEPVVRQVVTVKGETVNVASFGIRDDVGAARLTLWREQVEGAAKLRVGTRVKITGLRVRPGLGGQLELSSIPLTKIETMSPVPADRPAWEDIRHVIALEAGLETWVKGVVLEPVGASKLSAVCEDCGSSLVIAESGFTCNTCAAERKGKIVFNGRLRIDDGTGAIDLVLTNEDATPLGMAYARGEMLEQKKTEMNVDRESLVGKELEIHGTAEPSESGGKDKLEFRAKRILVAAKL